MLEQDRPWVADSPRLDPRFTCRNRHDLRGRVADPAHPPAVVLCAGRCGDGSGRPDDVLDPDAYGPALRPGRLDEPGGGDSRFGGRVDPLEPHDGRVQT